VVLFDSDDLASAVQELLSEVGYLRYQAHTALILAAKNTSDAESLGGQQ